MFIRPVLRFVTVLSTVSLLVACGGDDDGSSATEGTGASGGTGSGGAGVGGGTGGGAPPMCEAGPVPCEDEVFLNMNLQAEPTPGEITNMADGAGWISLIDATAGGPFATDPDSYTYGKFGEAGLEKVAISDEQSLGSSDWDIAFRRYVVRINSGYSGPSCVTAARIPGMGDYDGTTVVPGGLTYREDDYFTEACTIIPDGSGLPNSPATALSSYWTYPGCVAMTGNVFVIALADGRQLKLQVTHFYNEAAQEQCDTTGMVPMMGNDSGNFRVRWAFLP